MLLIDPLRELKYFPTQRHPYRGLWMMLASGFSGWVIWTGLVFGSGNLWNIKSKSLSQILLLTIRSVISVDWQSMFRLRSLLDACLELLSTDHRFCPSACISMNCVYFGFDLFKTSNALVTMAYHCQCQRKSPVALLNCGQCWRIGLYMNICWVGVIVSLVYVTFILQLKWMAPIQRRKWSIKDANSCKFVQGQLINSTSITQELINVVTTALRKKDYSSRTQLIQKR